MDHPGPEIFNGLLNGYLRESLNPQDLALFFELAKEPANLEILALSFAKELNSDPPDLTSDIQKQEAWTRLNSIIEMNRRPVRQMRGTLRWVAALVCLLGATAAFYIFSRPKTLPLSAQVKSEIKTPAWLTAEHIGATLILGNGDSVVLNNQERGVIANQDGIQVLQSDGAIRYSGENRSGLFNEIRTGDGKLWRVVLPDQTVVWLNGGSSLKYPLQFGTGTRTVEMSGEAYFDVSHHADYPFQVKTAGMLIEDIGTSFNIKSSVNDTVWKTTLVAGSARVTDGIQEATLIAGQQSLVSTGNNSIRVEKNVNLTEALAWKNGFFYFRQADLTNVMTQISDWYQAKVIYKGTPGKELFNGQIDKTLSLSDVLQGLQQPGVKFNLDSNRQITVIQN